MGRALRSETHLASEIGSLSASSQSLRLVSGRAKREQPGTGMAPPITMRLSGAKPQAVRAVRSEESVCVGEHSLWGTEGTRHALCEGRLLGAFRWLVVR